MKLSSPITVDESLLLNVEVIIESEELHLIKSNSFPPHPG